MKVIILLSLLFSINIDAAQNFKLIFEQKYKSKISNRDKVSKGFLVYSYPKKIRIEIEKPDLVIFVSNGMKSWYYRPPFIAGEPGEVIVNSAGDSLNLLATFFDSIQKGFDKNKAFEAIKNENTITLNFSETYRKKLKVKMASLSYLDKTYNISKIQKMILTYENDEKGEFFIVKYETPAIDNQIFDFQIPTNTKISN